MLEPEDVGRNRAGFCTWPAYWLSRTHWHCTTRMLEGECGGSGGRDDRRASLQCQVDGDGALMVVRRAGCQWGPMETARRADVATVRQCGRGGEDSCMGRGEKWTLRGTAHGRATLAWRRSGGWGMGGDGWGRVSHRLRE